MNRILGRVMLGLLALFVLGYAGFQIWRSIYVDYDTTTAEDFIVSDVITAQGVAFREETVLGGHSGENLSYLHTDGTHVSKDMPVARVVRSRSDITDQMRRDALRQELENLAAIPVVGNAMILQTDSVSQRAYADVDKIALGAARGTLAGAQELKSSILSQLNRRIVATYQVGAQGDESPFEDYIAVLGEQLLTIGESIMGDDAAVTAAEPGYFTKTVDGLEAVLTPDALESFTVDEFAKYIAAPQETVEDAAGKIITAHVWYFAVLVNASEQEKFREGRRVELDFGLSGQSPFLAKIKTVKTDERSARMVVVFECSDMGEALSNIRTHKVDISLQEMTGFRFPRESKHYEYNQLGVYVLETAVIRFKPVEIIYENEKEDFVVYSTSYKAQVPGYKDKVGLSRFDEVIIGGMGLEDGKIIKQLK